MIKNVVITDNKVNLSHPFFSKLNEKQMEEFQSLLPIQREQSISFEMENTSLAIAHGIKRYVTGEHLTKALSYDRYTIDTDSAHAICEEIHMRIIHIPLDQDCPDDVIFNIEVANDSDKDLILTSGDIVASDGKNYFNQHIPIFELGPKQYMIINNIVVVAGYNYQSSAFSVTSNIIWNITDYVDVPIMSQKSIRISRVLKKDLELIKKKHKATGPVIIIPDVAYEAFHNLSETKYADYIKIENRDNELLVRQSSSSEPREFEITITTNGNIDPLLLLKKYFTDTSNKLSIIKNSLQQIVDSNIDEFDMVSVSYAGNMTIISIIGETYTIGEILRRYIYDADQTIPMVNITCLNGAMRSLNVNILHQEPMAIIMDAIDHAVADLISLGSLD